MIEQWVTEKNPKASFVQPMPDVGQGMRLVVPSPGEFGTRCTDYLPLEQLEQHLFGVFYANDFNQRMGRVI